MKKFKLSIVLAALSIFATSAFALPQWNHNRQVKLQLPDFNHKYSSSAGRYGKKVEMPPMPPVMPQLPSSANQWNHNKKNFITPGTTARRFNNQWNMNKHYSSYGYSSYRRQNNQWNHNKIIPGKIKKHHIGWENGEYIRPDYTYHNKHNHQLFILEK